MTKNDPKGRAPVDPILIPHGKSVMMTKSLSQPSTKGESSRLSLPPLSRLTIIVKIFAQNFNARYDIVDISLVPLADLLTPGVLA